MADDHGEEISREELEPESALGAFPGGSEYQLLFLRHAVGWLVGWSEQPLQVWHREFGVLDGCDPMEPAPHPQVVEVA